MTRPLLHFRRCRVALRQPIAWLTEPVAYLTLWFSITDVKRRDEWRSVKRRSVRAEVGLVLARATGRCPQGRARQLSAPGIFLRRSPSRRTRARHRTEQPVG